MLPVMDKDSIDIPEFRATFSNFTSPGTASDGNGWPVVSLQDTAFEQSLLVWNAFPDIDQSSTGEFVLFQEDSLPFFFLNSSLVLGFDGGNIFSSRTRCLLCVVQ